MLSYTQALNRLIPGIVEQVHPLRIILFGSSVNGTRQPDSDIDLLIIMPEGCHRRHTAQHLYQTLRGIGVPYDLIVATPTDLERHKNNLGLIYHTILQEGQEIYAA